MLLVSVVNVSIRNEFDSILHSFVECEEAKSFFDEVISWFNKTNNSRNIHQQWPRNFLECFIMEMTKNYLNSTNAYSLPNNSYIVKN